MYIQKQKVKNDIFTKKILLLNKLIPWTDVVPTWKICPWLKNFVDDLSYLYILPTILKQGK
jgi:hypothetical protein